MRALRLVSFAVMLVSAALPMARAWGPASHYYFTCTARGVPLAECLTSPAHNALLSGTEMPDAFFFAGTVSPLGPVELPGNGWSYRPLHSPVFAGYLFKNAAAYTTSTFNATEFAVGFGMHVTADAAGFLPGGYLNYGWQHTWAETNPFQEDTANWLSIWPFMAAVDAHVFQTFVAPLGVSLPTVEVPTSSAEAAAFIVAVVQDVLRENVPLPSPTAANVSEVANLWSHVIGEESRKAEVVPAAAYEFEMVYQDKFGATTFAETAANFDMASACAVGAARRWHALIQQANSTPVSATEGTMAFLKGAFAAGLCAPLPEAKKLS